MQADANRKEMAPLMGLLGMATPPAAGLTPVPTANTKTKMKPMRPSSIGAIGICGISGALSSVCWLQPGGGVDADTFAKAARWELYNPWARIAETVSTHPLTARRVQALMGLNQRWGIPSEFDFSLVKPGKYGRFVWDLFLVLAPYLLAAGAVAASRIPGVDMSVFQQIGVGLAGFFFACAVIHFSMYKPGFVRARVLGLLSELNVSHINPKPVIVEGVFTGYMESGTPWAHHFVLQDDTGFVATQYRQPFGMEYVFGLFKTGRSLGRPVKVVGWYRRFGHPTLEISSFQFLDTMEEHRAHYPIFRFVLFVLGFLAGVAFLGLKL
jgi:hypothetical protein